MNELNTDGRLAFIMPFEFFNTGYGREIKKSLLDNHLLKQIVIISNEKDVFPDATTTVCVLFCKNDGRNNSIKITNINNNLEIECLSDISKFYQVKIDSTELPYNKKWTPIIQSLLSPDNSPKGFCHISNYGKFSRGIATGANEFFALRRSIIDEYNLNSNNFIKCITKSNQIVKAIFTDEHFDSLCIAD